MDAQTVGQMQVPAVPAFWGHDSGFRVQGVGVRVQGSGFRVQGSGFRAQGSGFSEGSDPGGRYPQINTDCSHDSRFTIQGGQRRGVGVEESLFTGHEL